MAGRELPGTDPQLPGDARSWALAFFFFLLFFPLMITPKKFGSWEGGALAIGTFGGEERGWKKGPAPG